MTDKVEQCLRARPFKEMNVDDVWEQNFIRTVWIDRQTSVAVDRLKIIMN